MNEIENVYKEINDCFTSVTMDIKYHNGNDKANCESLKEIVNCFRRTKKFEYLIEGMNKFNLIKGEKVILDKIENYDFENYDNKSINRTLFDEFKNNVIGYISIFKNLYIANYMRNYEELNYKI